MQTEKERKETDIISHLVLSNRVGMMVFMRWAVRKGIICWKMSKISVSIHMHLNGSCSALAGSMQFEMFCFYILDLLFFVMCWIYLFVKKEAAVHDIISQPLQNLARSKSSVTKTLYDHSCINIYYIIMKYLQLKCTKLFKCMFYQYFVLIRG